MSDKHLSELEWRKFSKGRQLKDAGWVKALAALEIGKTAQDRLEALDEIDSQLAPLRKACGDDKELVAWLDEAGKAMTRERKLQEFEARKEAAAAQKDNAPELLTTRLPPLLREVKKGGVMKTMVALAGKEVAVMVSRRQVTPAQRQLLMDYLGVKSGVKFSRGELCWEEGLHTFVQQLLVAGMDKKLKAALLKQTGLRLKLQVRG